jgi:hypothetical protein
MVGKGRGAFYFLSKFNLYDNVFWQCREVHGVWVFSLGSVTC